MTNEEAQWNDWECLGNLLEVVSARAHKSNEAAQLNSSSKKIYCGTMDSLIDDRKTRLVSQQETYYVPFTFIFFSRLSSSSHSTCICSLTPARHWPPACCCAGPAATPPLPCHCCSWCCVAALPLLLLCRCRRRHRCCAVAAPPPRLLLHRCCCAAMAAAATLGSGGRRSAGRRRMVADALLVRGRRAREEDDGKRHISSCQ